MVNFILLFNIFLAGKPVFRLLLIQYSVLLALIRTVRVYVAELKGIHYESVHENSTIT